MRKKYFVKNLPVLLCLVAFALLPSAARGQVSWNEAFDYPAGNLSGLGSWVSLGYNYANPVQVQADALDYEGYAGTVPAKSVKLAGTNGNQDVMTPFVADASAKGVTSGELFASMLVRVNSVPTTAVTGYFFSFLKATAVLHDFTSGSSPYDWGRVFVCPGSESGKFHFGVSYYKSSAEAQTGDLETGKTYHIVAKVAINENGDMLDNFYLYVDPASATEVPSAASASSKGSLYSNVTDDKAGYGLKGVALWQKMGWGAGSFDVDVADLRVSDSYAGLFAGGSTPGTAPAVTASASELDFGELFTGTTATRTLNVKGSNLKGDITVTSDNAALTPSAATVKASDASGANGADVTLTLKPTEAATAGTATVTLASDGAEPVTVTAKWEAVKLTEVATVKELAEADAATAGFVRFTGKALVSFVDNSTTPATYYIQDSTAGIQLKDDLGVLGSSFFTLGDELTGMVGVLAQQGGQNHLALYGAQQGLISSSHNNIVPVAATLAQIAAAPKTYANRVVSLAAATLSGFDEGAKFAEGMELPSVTDASGATGKLGVFKGTTLIGTDIPTGAVNIVGLSTSVTSAVIAPRQAEDITEAQVEEPGITLSAESFLNVRGKVGSRTEAATLHVKAVGMTDKVTIAPSYSVQSVFSTDVTELPAGTSETDVKIYYEPDAVGKHNGYIYFNVGSDLVAEVRINAMATDPSTPPSLAFEPAVVEDFKAAPGEEVTATVKVTPAGLPDFVNVRLDQEGSAFHIGATMLSAKGEQELKITFRPQTAGTYVGSVVFSSEFFDEDIVLPLTGTCSATPDVPEGLEGDIYGAVSKDNPVTELDETFAGVTADQPLSLEGWKNFAVTGLRAWWGCDADGNGTHAAKVTGYDSSVEAGSETDCQMLLLTPPLDYLNAKTQLFSFKVMGEGLTDGMDEKLEVCYITADADGTMSSMPLTQVTIPASAAEAGVWKTNALDFDGLNFDDVFFIGFRFTGTRGASSTATYYISDVTYGLTSAGIGAVGAATGKMTGVRVLDLAGRVVRTAASVEAAGSGLPAGTYLMQTSTTAGQTVKKFVTK